MALKDYFEQTETVRIDASNSIQVSAVTLGSLLLLVKGRMDEVKALYDKAVADGIDKNPTADTIVTFLAKEAPLLLGDIIAAAAGEPGEGAKASKLPIGVQLDALNKIMGLTFEAEGGVKKFVESVVDLTEKVASINLAMQDTLSNDTSSDFIGQAQS